MLYDQIFSFLQPAELYVLNGAPMEQASPFLAITVYHASSKQPRG